MATIDTPTMFSPALTKSDEYDGEWPDRIPPARLRELSKISPWRSMMGIAVEWLGIVAAIWLSLSFWHPALYVVVVAFIGARQHALAILNHEAAHYRLFRNRFWNDAVSNLFLAWPVLISVEWFRKFHWPHHSHLGTEHDGNRPVYRTHTPDGELTPLWTFPKTPGKLAAVMLFDLCGGMGLVYLAMLPVRMWTSKAPAAVACQIAYYGAIAVAAFSLGIERQVFLYWIVPLCTWFVAINHLRIIAEHSGLPESHDAYAYTRTTMPTLLERIFVLPKHVNFHLEHHIYPSVPYYRLPELHAELMAQPGYAQRAHITRSLAGLMQELTQSAEAVECARG